VIFKPQLARAVDNGRKTATRRPVKSGQPCRYKVGHDYAVQPGRGKPAICRLKVRSVELQRVGAITHADAVAEGFKNAAAFKVYWTQMYSKKWIETRELALDDVLSEAQVLDRFEAAHADTFVWAITFERMADVPRFLAASGRGEVLAVNRNVKGQPEDVVTDYTRSRARAADDLECVDETALARYAKAAEAHRVSFLRDLEAERARRAAASPRGQARTERGRSVRRAA
jgi:uncharacterized protein YhfF